MLRKKISAAVEILLLRNIAGLALNAVALVLIFWKLDAAQFAPIVQCQLLLSYAVGIGGLGLDAVVLRSGGSIPENSLSKIYTTNLAGSFVALLATAAIVVMTLGLPVTLVLIMAFAYMVRAISAIPGANLESRIDFKPQAINEFTSQIVYLLSITILLSAGLGTYGIALGILASQIAYATGMLGKKWRISMSGLDHITVTPYIKQGMALQYNNWIWQMREASIPLILRTQGLDAMLGSYGAANQIAQKIAIIRQIAWRIAVPAMANEIDTTANARGITYASKMLLAIICPTFLLAGVFVYALESCVGERWNGVLIGFSAIGTHVVLNSAFTIQCAGLMAAGKFRTLALFHTAFVVTFCLALILFTDLGLPLALIFSEACAALTYGIVVIAARATFSGEYYSFLPGTPIISALGLCVGAATNSPLPMILALALVIMIPENRKTISSAIKELETRLNSIRRN